MATLALLVPAPGPGIALGSSAAERLAGLGVTRISLLQDTESVAIVLEGWAFDPEQSGRDVETILVGESGRARVFRDLAQLNLSRT